ncbi:MAG: PD40 domain-containing protein [Acidobacteria bacterium]|nr:PD40 domain-containing protein [Acidobacteriota bacterium]
MRPRQLILILATAASLFAQAPSAQAPSAQAPSAQANVTLQRAMRKETLEGDLKGAIALYGKAVAEAKGDRATAAKALIRMAECHQKLGNAESRRVYERVVREYADQKEAAALAHTRLSDGGTFAQAKGDRALWTGPKVDLFGRVSQDGRFISFTDWSEGAAVAIHDLRTGMDRQLVKAGFGSSGYIGGAQFSTFSKDGKQIAYEWYDSKNQVQVRVVPVEGSGNSEPHVIFANPDVASINVSDWSPDRKWLAVHLRRKDRSSQIALIGADNGQLRVLKTVDWRGPSKLFFSPDGRQIVYDLPVSDASPHRSLFILDIDGSHETAVVENPSLNLIMGWAPDGQTVVFSSDRTGTMALYALGIANGKAQGQPRQVKAEGPEWSLGFSSTGALMVFKSIGNQDLRIAALDVTAGKISEIPSAAPTYIASRGRPDWSWDGRSVSYASCGNLGGANCRLLIRSTASGQIREVSHTLNYFVTARWSPDGSRFVMRGTDFKGRNGIFIVDAHTGVTTLVAEIDAAEPQWFPDGKSISYLTAGNSRVLRRDLTTGNERSLYESPDKLGSAVLSRDGRYLLATTRAISGKGSVALLVPVDGGQPRELLRVNPPDRIQGFGGANWMPDGSAALLIKGKAERKGNELWFIPINGGQPRKLNVDMSEWAGGTGFTLHPSGHQIAFVSGERQAEIWSLENFLPPVSAKW